VQGQCFDHAVSAAGSATSSAVKWATARDLVKRNVVELAEVPVGRSGRPSKSLSPEQVDDVLTKTATDRLHNYVVLSLHSGGRTAERRALRWEHVHLEARTDVVPPVPPSGAARQD
jgi:integrase